MTPDEFALTIISGIVVALSVLGFGYAIKFFQIRNSRNSYLKSIKKQLENDKKIFSSIKKDLQNDNIPTNFDTTIYHSFISSEYYNPEKDSDYVEKLQEHLANVGKYENAMVRINQLYALRQGGALSTLENSLISTLSVMADEVDPAITEIDKLINEKRECCCKNLFNRNKPKEKTEESIDKIKKEENKK